MHKQWTDRQLCTDHSTVQYDRVDIRITTGTAGLCLSMVIAEHYFIDIVILLAGSSVTVELSGSMMLVTGILNIFIDRFAKCRVLLYELEKRDCMPMQKKELLPEKETNLRPTLSPPGTKVYAP